MKKLKVKCAKPLIDLIFDFCEEKKTHSHTTQWQWENLVTKLDSIMLEYALKYATENFVKKNANKFDEFECQNLWIFQFLILPTLPQATSKSISNWNFHKFACCLPWIHHLLTQSNEFVANTTFWNLWMDSLAVVVLIVLLLYRFINASFSWNPFESHLLPPAGY